MFSIDTRDPTQLRLVGKPVDTLGDFPVTVDMSERLGQGLFIRPGRDTHAE